MAVPDTIVKLCMHLMRAPPMLKRMEIGLLLPYMSYAGLDGPVCPACWGGGPRLACGTGSCWHGPDVAQAGPGPKRVLHSRLQEMDSFCMTLNQERTIYNSLYVPSTNEPKLSPPCCYKLIWKIKIPLKIKIFLWYLKGVILNKNNLSRKN
jgi:hypothetical protein